MLRVIIVDDEILAIELLARFLSEIGNINVIATFTRASDALAFLQNDVPDIIFLDIEMPDMNGILMGENLRSRGMFSDIVYVTAYDHYAVKAFEVHATDYIMKPIEKERLSKTIRTIVERKGHARIPAVKEEVTPDKGLTATLMGAFVLYSTEGQPIKWRTKKVKELCAYLLHQNRSVHRYQVIDDLWPDTPVEKAVSLLYTTVYQLRKMFLDQSYAHAIAYVDERFSLSIEVATDIQQVKDILQENRREEKSVRNLLELTINEYLDQEDYPWCINQQSLLKAECIQYFEKWALSEANLHLSPETRLLCLNRLLHIDPYNEQYYTQLIQHYLRMGENQKAQDIYRNYKKMMQTEFGMNIASPLEHILRG